MDIAGINIDVGSVLGGIGTLAKDIRSAITGEISPEKKSEIESKILELESQTMMAQIAVNAKEAENANVFVSGWRPFIGWVCGFTLLYNYIVLPFSQYLAAYFVTNVPALPALETGELMTLLFGMLGFGGYRTFEKFKGVSAK